MGSFAVPGALPLAGRMHCQLRQRSSAPHSQAPAPSLRPGRLVVSNAKARDPPDTPKDRAEPSVGREWLQTLLSRFGPITEKAQNTAVLDFEKPLVELDNRIKEVRSSRGILLYSRTLPDASARAPLSYLPTRDSHRVIPSAHAACMHYRSVR